MCARAFFPNNEEQKREVGENDKKRGSSGTRQRFYGIFRRVSGDFMSKVGRGRNCFVKQTPKIERFFAKIDGFGIVFGGAEGTEVPEVFSTVHFQASLCALV